MASITAQTAHVISMIAPNTSPLTPPNLFTQCRVSSSVTPKLSAQATTPTSPISPPDTASSSVHQQATVTVDCVPAVREPKPLFEKGGKPRQQAVVAAAREATKGKHSATTPGHI